MKHGVVLEKKKDNGENVVDLIINSKGQNVLPVIMVLTWCGSEQNFKYNLKDSNSIQKRKKERRETLRRIWEIWYFFIRL